MGERKWTGTTYGNGWMHRWLIRALKYVDVRFIYAFSSIFVVPVCLLLNPSRKIIYQYFKEREIIIKEPKKVGWVWSFGPSIGYGGFVDAQNGGFGHGPYIGVSIGIGIGSYINK